VKSRFLTASAAVFFVFYFGISPASGGDVTWNPAINLSVAGQDGWDPQVTMDETGHAVAVWYRSNGSNNIIQESYSSDYGASWSLPSDLSDTGQHAYNPQVTMDETGHVVAVWERHDGLSYYIIQGSHSSDYGVTWSTPSDLSESYHRQVFPLVTQQVTMDETGHAIAVWERYDGSNHIIQVSSVADTDGDGTSDILDECPEDVDKIEPGECGCGVADTDSDGDGTLDCFQADTGGGNNVPIGDGDGGGG
jgi:hypothetical protein